MKLLFVSGTVTGGAAISTFELADRLARRGHSVGVLARRRANDVRLRRRSVLWGMSSLPARARRVVERAIAVRPPEPTVAAHGPLWTVRHLETTVARVLDDFMPDVAVVNSVHERAWRVIRGEACRRAVPTVLYIREAGAVGHIERGHLPDLVMTNARSHATALVALGVDAIVVPSVVETRRALAGSTRATVLLVNPIPSRGLDTAVALARLRPDVRFAFQESHRLRRGDWRVLRRILHGVDNVEVRRYEPDQSRMYRDAAVLLAPYTVDNRPRVVLEAHANGIPLIASDRPGLDECVGPGGVLVAPDAGHTAWAAALRDVLDDPARYERLVEAARAHARRPEVDPDVITAAFEAAVSTVVRAVPLAG